MNIRIELDSSAAGLIEHNLLQSLRASLAQAQNDQIVLVARTDRDTVVGGLVASTSYGWLLIKSLWIDVEHRRKGIGMSLMREAESKGRAAACHSAWLDTSNPQSKKFYQQLGYESFAELANKPGQRPETHRRWFMQKSL